MPPIRKGDGTPVEPKGVSKIRTGDGRILFDGPAIPDSVVDDLESGDLTRYQGDTGTFSVVLGGVAGEFAIESDGSNDNLIYSDDPIDDFIPTKGMSISFFGRSEFSFGDSPQAGFAFCLSGTSTSDMTGYYTDMAHGQNDDGKIRILRIDDGNIDGEDILREDIPSEIDLGNWFEIELFLHDGNGGELNNTIEMVIHQIDQTTGDRQNSFAIGTVQDDNYLDQDQFFGWVCGGSGNVEKFGDEYKITGTI